MMQFRHGLHGFTLTEILVLLLVALVLVGFFTDIFSPHHSYERSRQSICISQVRQMATAAQMYNQDNNGRFPSTKWADEILGYLGNSNKMLFCPSDAANDTINMPISYGYSGLMVRPDGTGVSEAQLKAPTEVGVFCDATPTKSYPNGGLVGGGALQVEADIAVLPAPRHSGGTMVGYADGHAKYIPHGFNTKDLSNSVTRAFFMASALGLLDNPAGSIGDFAMPAKPARDPLTIGGEPCTYAILRAAADIWKQRAQTKYTVKAQSFSGQYAKQSRGASYLWSTGDGEVPAGQAVALARDAVVIITAKNSEIDSHYRLRLENGIDVFDFPAIRTLFSTGCSAKAYQAYTYNTLSGTRRYFTTHLADGGNVLHISARAITVTDDYAMVDKVANDPYGIGYCSSAIADPERVQIVGLQTPDGRRHFYLQVTQKYGWLRPDALTWPLTRTLYAQYGGNAWTRAGTGIVNVMLTPGAAGAVALQTGPLFQANYYPPK